MNNGYVTEPELPDAEHVELITRRVANFLAELPEAFQTAPNGIERAQWWDAGREVVSCPGILADSARSWSDPVARQLGRFLGEGLDVLRVAQRPLKYRRYKGPQSNRETAGRRTSIALDAHPGLVFDDSKQDLHRRMVAVIHEVQAIRDGFDDAAEARWALLRGFHSSMKNRDRVFRNVIVADRVLAELEPFRVPPSSKPVSKRKWAEMETRVERDLYERGLEKTRIYDLFMRVDEDPAMAARRIWRNITRSKTGRG